MVNISYTLMNLDLFSCEVAQMLFFRWWNLSGDRCGDDLRSIQIWPSSYPNFQRNGCSWPRGTDWDSWDSWDASFCGGRCGRLKGCGRQVLLQLLVDDNKLLAGLMMMMMMMMRMMMVVVVVVFVTIVPCLFHHYSHYTAIINCMIVTITYGITRPRHRCAQRHCLV